MMMVMWFFIKRRGWRTPQNDKMGQKVLNLVWGREATYTVKEWGLELFGLTVALVQEKKPDGEVADHDR